MAFRTQKISQMTPKGADLEATDLIEVSTIESGSYVTRSITGQELIDAIPAPTGFVPETRTLTINGVAQDLSADRSWTISTGLTVGTTPISSGVEGRILFQGTGNVLQQSSQLSWNNSTNALTLTTGKVFSAYQSGSTVNDALKLNVSNDGAVFGIQNSSATGFSGIEYLNNLGVSKVFTGFNNNDGQEFRFNNFATNGFIDFRIGGTSGFRLFTTRNVGINTTTDAGFRLDVNGTARVQSFLDVYAGSGVVAGANNPMVVNSNTWSQGSGLVLASRNTSDSSPRLTLRANSAGACELQLYNNGNKSYIRQVNLSGVGNASIYLFQLDNRAAKFAVTPDDSTTDASFFGKAIWDGGSAATFRASSATQTANIINVQNHDGTSTFLNVKPTGNLLINTTTDAGFRLDVNGTARVQGNTTVSLNQNNTTLLSVSNTTAGTLSNAALQLISDTSAGQAQVFKYSSTRTSYKTLAANDFGHYNATAGDISFLNDFASGQIKFAAGGSSTVHMTIKSNGRINMSAIPTSSAGLSAGDLWNDGGTLKIV